ncbi:LysM peptidoglycan-binding domain-containing protein [Pseudoalteromonas sp. NBT06-2]|uniref:LysM peptidoglycan-binding domain-containing protein n=1 Tax=Pseudoalteromonas sp. NBT06-2 TaxID=2025950 RepID=UPI00148393EF|nr:LysM peptidoglycan-binding domain-containing protein [Pseudoalteromonas sp. NBT06-2]
MAQLRIFIFIALIGCQTNSETLKDTKPQTKSNHSHSKLNHAKKITTIPKTPNKTKIKKVINKKPSEVSDLWFRIAMQLKFPNVNNKKIDKKIAWYLKHPNYMHTISKRSEPFIYHIVNQIEHRKLPLELALLPIVESDFDIKAQSNQGAIGIWQLMPMTAKHFNLQKNAWYDGRYDVLAATTAALDYLEYLYLKFSKNWLHAIAAYNSGEGRVKQAIIENKRLGKKTDFWSLNLPKETTNYVPKLLALSAILKQQNKYHFWPKLKNQATTINIDIGQQFDMLIVAKIAKIKMQTLYNLNPGYISNSSPKEGPHQLLVPISQAHFFDSHYQFIDGKLVYGRYQVKAKDSLFRISKRFNTTVSKLKTINQLTGDLIKVGQVLALPAYKKSELTIQYHISPYLQRKKTPSKVKVSTSYIVKKGDTLWDISQRYGVSFKELAKWNKMKQNAILKPSKTIIIWLEKDPAPLENKTKATFNTQFLDILNINTTIPNE